MDGNFSESRQVNEGQVEDVWRKNCQGDRFVRDVLLPTRDFFRSPLDLRSNLLEVIKLLRLLV